MWRENMLLHVYAICLWTSVPRSKQSKRTKLEGNCDLNKQIMFKAIYTSIFLDEMRLVQYPSNSCFAKRIKVNPSNRESCFGNGKYYLDVLQF